MHLCNNLDSVTPHYLMLKMLHTQAPITPGQVQDFLTFAGYVADEARKISVKWFRQPLNVEEKADLSPVTRADRDTESRIRELLSAKYPDHGIAGEEFDDAPARSEFIWVIDPIDGTRSFVFGVPTFGTLIALTFRGTPIAGVIDMPALGERWTGGTGIKSEYNGEVCGANQARTELSQSSIFATTPDMFSGQDRVTFDRVTALARDRRYGLDCYAYGLLASGHIDLVIEADLKPFDYLALAPVIENAGGVLTDWQGNPLQLDSGEQRVIAAANVTLSRKLLNEINR